MQNWPWQHWFARAAARSGQLEAMGYRKLPWAPQEPQQIMPQYPQEAPTEFSLIDWIQSGGLNNRYDETIQIECFDLVNFTEKRVSPTAQVSGNL